MAKIKIFVYSWLPVLLWAALIYYLSSFHKLQASEIGWQDFIVRKTAHFLEYAILCFLFYRALRKTTRLSLTQILILALFLTIVYSVSDEYHQTTVSGRTGRPFDVGVDGLGSFFGFVFCWKLINLLPERIKKKIL